MAGDYEPIAEPIFAGTAARRLLLEYDDHRSGGFAPLSAVPADKTVVLGLVSTKQASLEDPDELMGCIDSAARHIDGDSLAISTQCGFSTSVLGNALSLDDQAAKLALVADIARRCWR